MAWNELLIGDVARRSGLSRTAADLAEMLGAVRSILREWPTTQKCYASICPQIEAKGGETKWRSGSPSARRVRTVRKS
jgi:hypothetical protein